MAQTSMNIRIDEFIKRDFDAVCNDLGLSMSAAVNVFAKTVIMRKTWHDIAWDNYIYWQTQDRKTLKRINRLIYDIERNGYMGVGKPEPLKGNLAGWWSVRIDEKNRIVFRLECYLGIIWPVPALATGESASDIFCLWLSKQGII